GFKGVDARGDHLRLFPNCFLGLDASSLGLDTGALFRRFLGLDLGDSLLIQDRPANLWSQAQSSWVLSNADQPADELHFIGCAQILPEERCPCRQAGEVIPPRAMPGWWRRQPGVALKRWCRVRFSGMPGVLRLGIIQVWE